MQKEIMHMGTNARLICKVLTKYRNTFFAMKELINNSIIAKAKRIEINFDSKGNKEDWGYNAIDQITIRDNGYGVSYTDFYKSVMEVGTDNRTDGYGVGRFGGLQIGKVMTIETTAYDETQQAFTTTSVTLNAEDLKGKDLREKDFEVSRQILEGKNHNPYYEVRITSLYHNDPECPLKNKLVKEFFSDNLFSNKLFQHYPLYIFNEEVSFLLNGNELNRIDFVASLPQKKETQYTDVYGKDHQVSFTYYSLKLSDQKVRLFLQVNDGEVNTTALELGYNSLWYSPIMGAQYVIVESDYITKDLCDNFVLVDFREKSWDSFGTFIKNTIDEHYKKDNVKYRSFIEELSADKSYPFSESEKSESSLIVDVFNQSAFFLEEDLRLIEKNNSSKKMIYTLLRKVIEDGDLKFLIENVMGLNKESRSKLIELLDRTKLEDIISFSSSIAKRQTTLEILYQIAVTNIPKSIEARTDLNVLLGKELWLFGEEYTNTIASVFNSTTETLLNELFNRNIATKPSTKDGNLIDNCSRSVKAIGDLTLYNERNLGNSLQEMMVVNIRRPSCLFGQVDMVHVDSYIYAIQSQSQFVKRNTKYKIFFVVNQLSDYAKSQINSPKKENNEPFLYKDIQESETNIKVYIAEWSELIAHNRNMLSCMSETLKTKQVNAQAMFLDEYADLIERKNKGRLSIIK